MDFSSRGAAAADSQESKIYVDMLKSALMRSRLEAVCRELLLSKAGDALIEYSLLDFAMYISGSGILLLVRNSLIR